MGAMTGTARVVRGRIHFAYSAYPDPKKPEARVIVDGEESKAYNDVWPETMRWSSDGVLSYIARDGRKLLRVTQTLP